MIIFTKALLDEAAAALKEAEGFGEGFAVGTSISPKDPPLPPPPEDPPIPTN